jgi:hypothetical protein
MQSVDAPKSALPSRAEAIEAINRYKDPELDSSKAEVVDTYLLLRQSWQRVVASKLKKAMQNQKKDLTNSAAISTTYYLVPKSNFAVGGAPPDLMENLVTAAELGTMEMTSGCNMDMSAVYVVDENCPRGVLGRGVNRAVFQQKTQRRCTLRLGDEGNALADEATADEVAKAAAPKEPPQPPKRESRDEEGSILKNVAKRRCTLDRHVSAESDDDAAKQSEMTLEDVMAKMKAAAAAGRFHGKSTAATNTVSFLAALVVDSFAVEVAKKDEHEMILKYFPKFLSSILLDSRCYADLPSFKDILQKLEEKGGHMPPTSTLLKRLMQCGAGHEMISLSDVPLRARTRFLDCPLFADFRGQWAETQLQKLNGTDDVAVLSRPTCFVSSIVLCSSF